MGREATTLAHWRGETAEVMALLESTELIVRRAIRLRIPRATITGVRSEQGRLIVDVGADQLVLELGPVEATKWAATLLKPRPTLAHKLGVAADRPAFVVGVVNDPVLAGALDGATVSAPSAATMLIAVLRVLDDLETALRIARSEPTLPVWCVHGKGKHAIVTDAAVRRRVRAAGYIDNKTSAVSEHWTATRYAPRQ